MINCQTLISELEFTLELQKHQISPQMLTVAKCLVALQHAAYPFTWCCCAISADTVGSQCDSTPPNQKTTPHTEWYDSQHQHTHSKTYCCVRSGILIGILLFKFIFRNSRAPVSTDSSVVLVIRGSPRAPPPPHLENKRTKCVLSGTPRDKRERAVIWWNPAAQTRPVLDLSPFVPYPTLKRQNALLPYIQERERVHCKCTMQCTVHYIITLFNVGNVLLCVIYQLNFTVFVCYTNITLRIYSIAFGIIRRFK
jgi:hypothetical protein